MMTERRVLILLLSDGPLPDEAVRLVERALREGPLWVRVLAPVEPLPDAWQWDEGATRRGALARLDGALGRLERTGARVEGTVGRDRDPMVCLNWALRRESFDEVVVVGERRRARPGVGLAARIRRAYGLPVAHLPAASRATA